MIELGYSLSTIWNHEKNKFDLSRCDIETLTFNVFTGSIILKVNEVDFSAKWDWIPVLGFAREFFGCVESLSKKNLEIFSFTESDAEIILEAKGPDVQISASYGACATLVGFDDLMLAAQKFYRKVISDLADQYLDLQQNAHFKKLAFEARKGRILGFE